MTRVYLDHSATSPLRPEARAAMADAMSLAGNPSSVHREGRAARALVEEARETIARFCGGAAADTVFTSGATEANALALKSAVSAAGAERILVGASEHPSMLANAETTGVPVETVSLTNTGEVDLNRLASLLATGPRSALALMAINNETGVCHPLREAADLVREANGILIVDAVQHAPSGPFSLEEWDADYVTLSAHKLGGPKGVGALVAADNREVAPFIVGGGQEFRRRAGTENLIGIAGFAAAADAVAAVGSEERSRLEDLRRRLETALSDRLPELVIVSEKARARAPHISNLALGGAQSEMLVMALDLEGIAVSAGAACSSGKVAQSHVLAAMGLSDDVVQGAIRVSLGWSTVEADIDRFIDAFSHLGARLSAQQRPSGSVERTQAAGLVRADEE